MAHAWQATEVVSPHIDRPIKVIAAKDIPYILEANRLQTLNIYMPENSITRALIGAPIEKLQQPSDSATSLPRYQVHIHGGAWRDPNLLASSIEAAVAHAFAEESTDDLDAIISLNYTLASFPTHPTDPYDPTKNNHSDPAREAVHPRHIQDVLHAFDFLHSLGLKDDSYILSGHSAGSCLAFQASLFDAKHWRLEPENLKFPRPAALLGMNGLYGLPELVHHLGVSHANIKDVYADLLQVAFGDESGWTDASPLHFDDDSVRELVASGHAPKLVMVDQSRQDQLVPLTQMEMMKAKLSGIPGLQIVEGKRCTGTHASPWEQGYMIWNNIQDVLSLLSGHK